MQAGSGVETPEAKVGKERELVITDTYQLVRHRINVKQKARRLGSCLW